MENPDAMKQLPTVVALESLPVLASEKRGASIQINDRYLQNRISVLNALDEERFNDRIEMLHESRRILDVDEISVEAVEVPELREAADDLRETYSEIPEVDFLQKTYPGDCIVVPEFLRVDNRIDFGVRLFFFRENDAPEPTEISHKNVRSVVNDEKNTFDRYIGSLHGYPECCVTPFIERSTDQRSPETRSVAPLEPHIRTNLIESSSDVSINEIAPTFFETEHAYSFFARKFYPEPHCQTAQSRGKAIFEELMGSLNESLVRDYFRLNGLLDYTISQKNSEDETPAVGSLGVEHIYFYLPLIATLGSSRYST
ncbi:hypothetical protein [Halococcus salifodinae]|nr:hypothetical protein [Halococcus salifodinae]